MPAYFSSPPLDTYIQTMKENLIINKTSQIMIDIKNNSDEQKYDLAKDL